MGNAGEPIYAFGQPRRKFADPASLWVKITLSIVVGALLLFASSSGPKTAAKRAPIAPATLAARGIPARGGSQHTPPAASGTAAETPKTGR